MRVPVKAYWQLILRSRFDPAQIPPQKTGYVFAAHKGPRIHSPSLSDPRARESASAIDPKRTFAKASRSAKNKPRRSGVCVKAVELSGKAFLQLDYVPVAISDLFDLLCGR